MGREKLKICLNTLKNSQIIDFRGPKIGGNGGMRILEKNIQKQCIRRIRIVAHYVYVEVRWVKCLGSVE